MLKIVCRDGIVSLWASYQDTMALVGFFETYELACYHRRCLLRWYYHQSLPWDDFIADFI